MAIKIYTGICCSRFVSVINLVCSVPGCMFEFLFNIIKIENLKECRTPYKLFNFKAEVRAGGRTPGLKSKNPLAHI